MFDIPLSQILGVLWLLVLWYRRVWFKSRIYRMYTMYFFTFTVTGERYNRQVRHSTVPNFGGPLGTSPLVSQSLVQIPYIQDVHKVFLHLQLLVNDIIDRFES